MAGQPKWKGDFQVDPKSGFCKANGTYYSKRDPVLLPPPHHPLDVTTYIFSHQQNMQQIAFIDGPSGNTLSYSDLRHNMRAIAAGLHGLGVRKGDVVLVISPNSIAIPCIYLAILSIGAILITANPLSTEREIVAQVKDSKPVIAFTLSHLVHKFRATQMPLILIQGSLESRCVTTLHDLLQSDLKDMPSIDIRQDDTATLLYSSGTTGKSKGVLSTHRNYIASIAGNRVRYETEGCKMYLCSMPLFHIYGLRFMVCSLAAGATIVMPPKFDMEEILHSIEQYRVTLLPTVPFVLATLAKSTGAYKYDLGSLQEISLGGAPLGKDVILSFDAKFPRIRIGQGYGLTETVGAIAYTNSDEENRRTGTVGLLSDVVEAKVVDPDSAKPLPPNHRGELLLRGPTIMKGYFGNEHATASTLDSEGWLRTGDLCYFDEEGFLFVVDRLKDLIKYKAYQVAPAELEELLLSHPEISEAAVIPYPDQEAGQIPMAFVVRSPGSNLSERDVINFVAEQVIHYKKIRQVAFTNSIPKNASGKILRKDLIEKNVPTSRL